MWRRLGKYGLVLAVLVTCIAGASALAFEPLGKWYIRSQLLPKIEKRFGAKVTIAHIELSTKKILLHDFVLQKDGIDLARVEKIDVDYDWRKALADNPRPNEITLLRPQVKLIRDESGQLNFLQGGTIKKNNSRGKPHIGPSVYIAKGKLSLEDKKTGLQLETRDFSGEVDSEGGVYLLLQDSRIQLKDKFQASADKITLLTKRNALLKELHVTISQGQTQLWKGLSLSSIEGTLIPQGDNTAIKFSGSYGGADTTLWQAEGVVNIQNKELELTLQAAEFTLDKIALVLDPELIQDAENTTLEARLYVKTNENHIRISGLFDLKGLNINHPWLALETIKDLSLTTSIQAEYDHLNRKTTLQALEIASRGAVLQIEGVYEGSLLPERIAPRLSLSLRVPPLSCQTLLRAIPPPLISHFKGFKFKGNFEASLELEVDWTQIEELRLEGNVALDRCKLLDAPQKRHPNRLLEEFTHTIEFMEEKHSFVIGPSNPDFVPIDEVSPHIINSLMTTEDSRFFEHGGFIFREFRTAIVRNLQEGYFKYGASSITMQMIKNVLLHNKKTLARKFQELILTYFVESTLEKERILEIYLNAIEFGPKLYGIGPAARHYFGKNPSEVQPKEAVFFSSILPNPKGRYGQYCRNRLSRWTERKIDRVLDLMVTRGRLTVEEAELAKATPFEFDRSEATSERKCIRWLKKVLEKTPSTLPELDTTTDIPSGE